MNHLIDMGNNIFRISTKMNCFIFNTSLFNKSILIPDKNIKLSFPIYNKKVTTFYVTFLSHF